MRGSEKFELRYAEEEIKTLWESKIIRYEAITEALHRGWIKLMTSINRLSSARDDVRQSDSKSTNLCTDKT